MLPTTTPNFNYVQMIVSALSKKSKRTLSSREKSLKKQAEYFSPSYRDFIYKVISNNSLKIVNKYRGGCIADIDNDYELRTTLSKKRKNKIRTKNKIIPANSPFFPQLLIFSAYLNYARVD